MRRETRAVLLVGDGPSDVPFTPSKSNPLSGFLPRRAKYARRSNSERTLSELPPGPAGPISLQPHTEISPHCGYTDLVYRCHLGLVVPENCAIRVGTETQEWREGRTMIFEDSVEHSAWNRSDSVRVVLLLDFLKRPESEADMDAVLAIGKEFDRRYNVIS